MKVFGIGHMKTGTTTLGACLYEMGFRHKSFSPKLTRQFHANDMSNIWNVVENYDSFEDYPWPLIYKEADKKFPDSKFILTERKNSEVWFRSVLNNAKRLGPSPEDKIVFGFGLPFRHKDEYITQYEAHNQEVKAYFEGKPEKLLVVCWEKDSNMQDLYQFLGVEAASQDYKVPALNVSKGQKISFKLWVKNSARYFLISGLGYDPFLYRNMSWELEGNWTPR